MALESTASLGGRQRGKRTGVALKETDKYAWEGRTEQFAGSFRRADTHLQLLSGALD